MKHLLQAYHEARATASDVVSSVPPDKLTGWLEAKHGCDRPVVAWDVAVHRLSIEGARDNPQLACAGIVEAWRDFRDLGCVARRRRAHACRTHARRLTLVPVFEGTSWSCYYDARRAGLGPDVPRPPLQLESEGLIADALRREGAVCLRVSSVRF